jgi:hypothetical protein
MSKILRSLTLSGGDMGWKQTVILGGAVLLLAACDRATAPIANVRDGGVGAKAHATAPTAPNPLPEPTEEIVPDDCLGITLSSGIPGEPDLCIELDY